MAQQINPALNNQPVQTQPVQQMPQTQPIGVQRQPVGNKKKLWIWIAIVMLVLGLAAVGLYFFLSG